MFPGETRDFTGYTLTLESLRLKSEAIWLRCKLKSDSHVFDYAHDPSNLWALFVFLLFLYLGLLHVESHFKLRAFSEAL